MRNRLTALAVTLLIAAGLTATAPPAEAASTTQFAYCNAGAYLQQLAVTYTRYNDANGRLRSRVDALGVRSIGQADWRALDFDLSIVTDAGTQWATGAHTINGGGTIYYPSLSTYVSNHPYVIAHSSVDNDGAPKCQTLIFI